MFLYALEVEELIGMSYFLAYFVLYLRSMVFICNSVMTLSFRRNSYIVYSSIL